MGLLSENTWRIENAPKNPFPESAQRQCLQLWTPGHSLIGHRANGRDWGPVNPRSVNEQKLSNVQQQRADNMGGGGGRGGAGTIPAEGTFQPITRPCTEHPLC